MGPQQPIKINDPDGGHLKRRALLNKHLSKNKIQISPMRKQRFAISTFSIISNSNNAFSPLHILSYSMTWGFPMEYMLLNSELSLSLEMYIDYCQAIMPMKYKCLLLFSLFEFRLNVPMNIFQSCWGYM